MPRERRPPFHGPDGILLGWRSAELPPELLTLIGAGLSLAFNCHSHDKASVLPRLLRPQVVTRALLLSEGLRLVNWGVNKAVWPWQMS